MNYFLRSAAYIFHPLLMPLIGARLYFGLTPRFIEPHVINTKTYAIVIITILIPLISFFLLKNLGLIKSINLKEVQERKFPLMIQILLILVIIKMVFNSYHSPEMYYFFVGILAASLTALFMVLFKFKVSLHQMAIAGVTMFLIGVSIHFNINMLGSISVLCIINGLVASSRLHTKSHSVIELCFGFFIGGISQFLLFGFWV